MNKEILKELEEELLKEDRQITIGDTSKTTILKAFKEEDKPLENILITLYNMAKINQYKIAELEDNLNLLASRVYKMNEDFTKEEKEEISEALNSLELKQLKDIENCKDYLYDSLYCDEENLYKAENLRKELMNKIKYPTPSMNQTFKDLVAKDMTKRRCN